MIAVCIGLTALSLALTGLCIACGKWLHDSNEERSHLRDRLENGDAREDEYKSQRDVLDAKCNVLTKRLEQETQLRTIAEMQRNDAMRKATACLATHMKDATNEEIESTARELFRTPLSILPGNELLPFDPP